MPHWQGQRIWQLLLTRLFGKLADNQHLGWLKNAALKRYIQHFNVDMSEAAESDYKQYKSFNAFFTRALRDDARTIAAGENIVVSPVDGTLSEFGKIDSGTLLQAKAHYYDMHALLGGINDYVNYFDQGSYATCYLSPKDYHRIHMPIAGELIAMTYIPGKLFPVYPAAVQQVPKLFTQNERVCCIFRTAQGYLAVVFIGAMIVGAISTVWHGRVKGSRGCVQAFDYRDEPLAFTKGEELGQFELGSCVVFATSHEVNWDSALNPGQTLRMGQCLGKC